jgi:ABC-type Fe3+ transport system permease subunit
MTCILAGSAAAALLYLKGNSPASNSIKAMAIAPLASSGIVLGLGWLMFYGSRSHSLFAAVLVHAVLALPFAFNSVSGGLKTLPRNLLNAAAVNGASPPAALVTAILPLAAPQLRSAWAFAAVISLGELNAVMMLGLENWETLPLLIYRAVGAYRYGAACAAGTLLILCCALLLLFSDLPLPVRRNRGS